MFSHANMGVLCLLAFSCRTTQNENNVPSSSVKDAPKEGSAGFNIATECKNSGTIPREAVSLSPDGSKLIIGSNEFPLMAVAFDAPDDGASISGGRYSGRAGNENALIIIDETIGATGSTYSCFTFNAASLVDAKTDLPAVDSPEIAEYKKHLCGNQTKLIQADVIPIINNVVGGPTQLRVLSPSVMTEVDHPAFKQKGYQPPKVYQLAFKAANDTTKIYYVREDLDAVAFSSMEGATCVDELTHLDLIQFNQFNEWELVFGGRSALKQYICSKDGEKPILFFAVDDDAVDCNAVQ